MKKFLEKLKKKISPRFRFKARKGAAPLLLLGVPLAAWIKYALVAGAVSTTYLWWQSGKMLDGIEWLTAQIIILISQLVVWILGGLISFLVQTIINMAQWPLFTNAPAVIVAWGIARDVANMFFIILFLVMAFGTIIKKEQYSYKKLLLPILLMAIFVNFSLLICGLVIDFAQVIMLTFVNAFRDVGESNMLSLFGVEALLDLRTQEPGGMVKEGEIGHLDVAGIYILAAILCFIAVVVLAIVAIVLILRIVALWILCILSPFAFILYIVPGGQQYAQQWQKKFINQVIIGPVLAFFLWFAFYTVQIANEQTASMPEEATEGLKLGTGIFSAVLFPHLYAGFILGSAMMIGAVIAAKQLGVAGASMAGKGMDFMKKAGTGVAKKVGKTAAYYPKQWGKRIGYGVGDKTLAGIGRLPVVGTPALKARAKLRKKREYEEEKEGRWVDYLAEPDVDRILKRGMKFPHFLRTESARNTMLAVSDWKMKHGQTWDFDRDPQRNREQISKWTQWHQKQAGWSIDNQNNDRYRNIQRGQVIESFLFQNPHLIDENWMRINPDTKRPFEGIPDYQGNPRGQNELMYRLDRMPTAELTRWTHSVPDQDPARGRQILELQAESLLAKLRTMKAAGIDTVQPQYVAREPFGIMRDRISLRFSEIYSRRLMELKPKENPIFQTKVYDKPLFEWIGQARAAPSYGDQKRRQATQELYDEHGEDYINLPQYKENKDQYLNLKEFKNVQHAASTNERITNLTTDPDTITGVNNTIRRAETAKEKGAVGYEAARVGIDFDKLDFRAAGLDEHLKEAPAVGLMGKAKQTIIDQICEILKAQGKAPEEVEKFRESANMAGELDIIKKGISMTDAKRSLAHERLHRRVDEIPLEKRREIWNTLDDKEKEDVRDDFRKKYGRDSRDEDELIEEHIVEGLTSETRWAKKDEKGNVVGSRLHSKFKKGLEEKGFDVSVLTSNLTGQPRMEMGAENQFSLPQVVQAAQGGSTEGLSSELVAALDQVSNELKQVSGGLATVGKLGGSMGDLKNTISMTALRTRMDNFHMAGTIRENTNTWRRASANLSSLEKKYKQAA